MTGEKGMAAQKTIIRESIKQDLKSDRVLTVEEALEQNDDPNREAFVAYMSGLGLGEWSRHLFRITAT